MVATSNEARLTVGQGRFGRLRPLAKFTIAVHKNTSPGVRTGVMLRTMGRFRPRMLRITQPSPDVILMMFDGAGTDKQQQKLEWFEAEIQQKITGKQSRKLKWMGARAGLWSRRMAHASVASPPFPRGAVLVNPARPVVGWEPLDIDRFADLLSVDLFKHFGYV